MDGPTHPEHTKSVSSKYGDTFYMSLSGAVACEWLDPATKAAAQTILDSWQRPAIDSPEIQDWIRQVLGYFKNCYRGDGPEPECWNAGKLRIVKDPSDATSLDDHAGVHLIRKYYPEYQPATKDFQGAYWGTKPNAA